MEPTVLFRDFEERDIDFIYKCKNDEKLNKMIVGQYHPFTYEEAVKWVHGCMGEHETYKFWAVCTNDDEKRIIGWMSLSEIDKINKSICHHGIVIGDNAYRDGDAMFEAMLFSMSYAFDVYHTHRLYGSCLSVHKTSPHMMSALGFALEGIKREAEYKNGTYYDVLDYSLLEDEYRNLKAEGAYDTQSLIIKFVKSIKKGKNIDYGIK